MHPNETLIHRFYSAFSRKDYATMQQCYAEDAVFNDVIFRNLHAAEVRAMWEMFCTSGTDMQLEFRNIQANETNGKAYWEATYTFSKTGKKVVNKIQASFIFENGKIRFHGDHFSFYKWASQALGTTGVLLGWTPLIQNKVRKAARENLNRFMQKKNTGK